MHRFLLVGFLASLLGAGTLSGCGPKRCTPGATEACACMGGQHGVQQCTAEGAFGACDCGQLTEAEARRLTLAQSDFTDGVMCEMSVFPVSTDVYKVFSQNARDRDCLSQLEAAGIAAAGDCVNEGYCSERIIRPTARSRVENRRLKFRCGSVELAGISGITTTGNTATYRYDREVTLDQAVMGALPACQLEVAQAGRATRERTARRDDSGHWSLAPAH